MTFNALKLFDILLANSTMCLYFRLYRLAPCKIPSLCIRAADLHASWTGEVFRTICCYFKCQLTITITRNTSLSRITLPMTPKALEQSGSTIRSIQDSKDIKASFLCLFSQTVFLQNYPSNLHKILFET